MISSGSVGKRRANGVCSSDNLRSSQFGEVPRTYPLDGARRNVPDCGCENVKRR
jgi:hypothetical protein